jgi:hypothetical protein
VLIVNLYFVTTSDASEFMSKITRLNRFWRRTEATCPRMYTSVLPHTRMEPVYHTDYDTDAKLHSPNFALHDLELKSIGLNDKKKLHMFERHVFASSETKSYVCHIASAKRYKKHARNKNNLCMRAGCFTSTSMGRILTITSPACLLGRRRSTPQDDHELSEWVNPKQLRTYIYADDANLMCHFFQLKHAETAEMWAAASLDVPIF